MTSLGTSQRPRSSPNTRSSRSFVLLACAVAVVAAAAPPALAQGTAFAYQGRLTDNGSPAGAAYDFRFVLYDAPVAGSQVGPALPLEDVAVADGLFTVWLDFGAAAFTGGSRWLEIGVRPGASAGAYTTLGSRQELTPSPLAMFSTSAASANTAPWSGLTGVPSSFPPAAHAHGATDVTSGTLADARLSANVAFLGTAQTFSAAKAFSAAPSFTAAGAPFTVTSATRVANLNADLLDGKDSTQFAAASPPLTLSGTEALHIIKGSNAATTVFASAVIGESTAATGTTFGVRGQNLSPDGTGVFGLHDAASGTAPGVYGQSDSATSGAAGVYGLAGAGTGSTFGVFGESASSVGRGVRGLATATSGIGFGVFGESASSVGRGVFGYTTAFQGSSYAVFGQANSSVGIGVAGLASASAGNNYGVFGQSNSPTGRGVYGLSNYSSGASYGVHGVSLSSIGSGVYGESLAATGLNFGVTGETANLYGAGVHGVNTFSGYNPDSTTLSSGVFGEADGDLAAGVYGLATSASVNTYHYGGFFDGNKVGVAGRSSGSTGWTQIGVLGYVPSAGSGGTGVQGEHWNGGVGVYAVGRLEASGTKSFSIDHPLDPANKYLNHYCEEGPEPYLVYRGTAVLDAAGEAWVDLPSYFDSINRDPHYQLTPVGAFAPIFVASKVATGRFKIAGGTPGLEVSWTVTGVRNDAFVRTYGAPVERDKPETLRGKYIEPQLYGLPREAAIGFRGEPEGPADRPPTAPRMPPPKLPESKLP